jgi:hypothetical protein
VEELEQVLPEDWNIGMMEYWMDEFLRARFQSSSIPSFQQSIPKADGTQNDGPICFSSLRA